MDRIQYSAIVVVILLVIVVFGLRFLKDPDQPFTSGPVPAQKTSSPAPPEPELTSKDSPGSFEAALDRALVRQQLPQTVMDLARDWNPEAALQVRRQIKNCAGFIQTGQFEGLYASEEQLGASEERLRYMLRFHEHCKAFAALLGLEELDPGYWDEVLRQANHPVIKVEQALEYLDLGDQEKADKLAVEVLASRQPDAIFELMNLGDRRWRDSLLAGWQPEVDAETYTNAMGLLLCELGWAECQPYSGTMWYYCERVTPDCDAGQSYPDYLAATLSEEDYLRAAELFLSFNRNLSQGDFSALLPYLKHKK